MPQCCDGFGFTPATIKTIMSSSTLIKRTTVSKPYSASRCSCLCSVHTVMSAPDLRARGCLLCVCTGLCLSVQICTRAQPHSVALPRFYTWTVELGRPWTVDSGGHSQQRPTMHQKNQQSVLKAARRLFSCTLACAVGSALCKVTIATDCDLLRPGTLRHY